MIQKFASAITYAREAFLKPVGWRLSPDAHDELRDMARPSPLAGITESTIMGLPFEVDRTLNGSSAELVTDPPAHTASLTASLTLADLRAMEAMRDAVERRP